MLTPDAAVVILGGPRTPVVGPLGHVVKMRLAALGSSRRLVFYIARCTRADFMTLKDLCEAGRVKPLVEQVYPLTQIARAMHHIGRGHARGKIVVRMQ